MTAPPFCHYGLLLLNAGRSHLNPTLSIRHAVGWHWAVLHELNGSRVEWSGNRVQSPLTTSQSPSSAFTAGSTTNRTAIRKGLFWMEGPLVCLSIFLAHSLTVSHHRGFDCVLSLFLRCWNCTWLEFCIAESTLLTMRFPLLCVLAVKFICSLPSPG